MYGTLNKLKLKQGTAAVQWPVNNTGQYYTEKCTVEVYISPFQFSPIFTYVLHRNSHCASDTK
jgi:hypothetical protein